MSAASSRLGGPAEIFCPCVDCRNVCHQSAEKVLEHLVIRGMDPKYKICRFWSKHGDTRPDKPSDINSSENEAYELLRTAFMPSEDYPAAHQENAEAFGEVKAQQKLISGKSWTMQKPHCTRSVQTTPRWLQSWVFTG